MRILLLLVAAAFAHAGEFLTYDNTPLGTVEKPLILRTYMPDPGLDDDVFAHHGVGANSPKYTPKTGEDVKGEYQPVKGIPAAIAVNHGPALSYCFDTTECRLMYAWQGGFLDMYPYWGDPARGNRQSFHYVPHLVGNLFYMTKGDDPLHLDGKSLSAAGLTPRFLGYTLRNAIPEFRYKAGKFTITATFTPAGGNALHASFSCDPPAEISFQVGGKVPPQKAMTTPARFTIKGELVASFQGYPRNTKIKKASVEAGEMVYQAYGCLACHSTDGAKGHGPTFSGLHGSQRKIAGLDEPVAADDAYLLESMKTPNAKTVEGFPPNYMPPYQLKEIEYESLLLFIKSLDGEPE